MMATPLMRQKGGSKLGMGFSTAMAAILCLSLSSAALAKPHGKGSETTVIAYIFPQNQVLQPEKIDATKLTRINYAFANLQGGKIVEGFPSDPENYAVLNGLKRQNPSLMVLASVGGWLWSGNFSDMAMTRERRLVFIKSVVAFLEKYKLDGLDVDWEYPGMVGAGNHFRPEDTENYTLLLKELRERLDHEQHKLHRRLLLSIATGASSDFLVHTEMDKVQRYVDTVNLMAYDYYEPGSDATTGNHAPLFVDPDDPKRISADRSIQEFEKAGVPARKIVLGVPFYGHVWGDVADTKHGLFQPGKRVPDVYAKYGDIATNMLDKGYQRYWDATASAPYLYNASNKTFVSYEDPESLGLKCKYVLEHNLGGVMFWDYSGDPSGALLGTIHDALSGGSK